MVLADAKYSPQAALGNDAAGVGSATDHLTRLHRMTLDEAHLILNVKRGDPMETIIKVCFIAILSIQYFISIFRCSITIIYSRLIRLHQNRNSPQRGSRPQFIVHIICNPKSSGHWNDCKQKPRKQHKSPPMHRPRIRHHHQSRHIKVQVHPNSSDILHLPLQSLISINWHPIHNIESTTCVRQLSPRPWQIRFFLRSSPAKYFICL